MCVQLQVDENVLCIFVGSVSLEEAKALQCLANDVGVLSQICQNHL